MLYDKLVTSDYFAEIFITSCIRSQQPAADPQGFPSGSSRL